MDEKHLTWGELLEPTQFQRLLRAVDEKLLTCDELAEALRLRPATIRRWTYAGRIPAVRVGRRSVRYRLREVARVLLRDEPARAGGQ
jgi:excisionase family DNA binding protein